MSEQARLSLFHILLTHVTALLLLSVWTELEELVWHACKREYRAEAYDPFIESKNLEQAASKLLDAAAIRIADMVNGWVRVGFAQGNFNADNCLVGGRTMDYGTYE